MQTTLIVLGNLALVSIALNLYLLYRLKTSKSARPKSYELKEFLNDVGANRGFLKVERLDATNLFLRSPRDNE